MTEDGVISDADGLARAVDALADGTGPIAVDVERASGFRYSQRAYLVQMFRRDAGVFLFDPPALKDLSTLAAATVDAEWVFHAASQDIPSLRELDLLPRRLFDTELAARLLGYERVGLGAVVEQVLGITLAKEHSAADWSTRPLPEEWLEYARLDVLHLIDVRDHMLDELAAQGKLQFAEEEFAATLAREPKPVAPDRWRRLSGLHQVRGARQLAIARELWLSREALAEAEDIAPGRLVPDRALVAAVLAAPTSKAALAGLKTFTGRASRTHLDRWWQAIERGRTTAELPKPRPAGNAIPPPRAWAERNPEADARLKAVRPIIEQLAIDLHMPTENLLTPDHLRRVAWDPPEPRNAAAIGAALEELGARPWQIGQTAQKIADAFEASAQASTDAPSAAS